MFGFFSEKNCLNNHLIKKIAAWFIFSQQVHHTGITTMILKVSYSNCVQLCPPLSTIHNKILYIRLRWRILCPQEELRQSNVDDCGYLKIYLSINYPLLDWNLASKNGHLILHRDEWAAWISDSYIVL